jgi:thiamine biosynthesis lipoprotein
MPKRKKLTKARISGTLVAQVLLLITIASRSSAAAGSPTWLREEGSIDTMGTVFGIEAYGPNPARLKTAIADALNEARRLDAMLSNYRPETEWSKMNRLAALQPVHVSKELFELLAACAEYSRESEGTFDISVGPLMRIWGFYKGSGHLPSHSEVVTTMRSVGYQNVLLDSAHQTVRFAKKGVELDPGGIGKGYAVDRMAQILRKEGIRAAFISAGGSSLYALGAPPGEKGWRVDLQDPKSPSKQAASIILRDESVSTSGNYEKFFYADGKLWSHIMDPRTGYPAQGMLSVSVIAPKTIDSEAWAKPYYILGRQWTAEHKKKAFRVFMCEDRPGSSCAWVQ